MLMNFPTTTEAGFGTNISSSEQGYHVGISNTSLGTPLKSLLREQSSKILGESPAIPVSWVSETFEKFLPSLSFFQRAESAGLACLELCGTGAGSLPAALHTASKGTRHSSLLFFFFPLQSPPSLFYFSLLIRVGESEKPAHPQPVPSCQILEQHSQFLLGVRNRL